MNFYFYSAFLVVEGKLLSMFILFNLKRKEIHIFTYASMINFFLLTERGHIIPEWFVGEITALVTQSIIFPQSNTEITFNYRE